MNSTSNLVNPDGNGVIPVSELVRHARRVLEHSTPLGWVGGEISNLTRAASGHLYFTLKDENAQLRCTMWRNRAQLLPFQLTEGMRVEVRAQLTVYEPRGDMQLAVDHVRRAGLGNLFEALMRLKARLAAEGLFDTTGQRPLPVLPRAVGVVTSPAAAALHDVLVTLHRRAPALPVVIYPTPVQGDGAGARIAQAITLAGQRARQDGIEALILCRGGGSLEDLWAFNDEAVVRAIRACAVPVVSGVGHETDTCLCDFAADLRAATPTAAAEAVSAGYLALRERLPLLSQRLGVALARQLGQAQQRLDLLERSLQHPRQRLATAEGRLQQYALRLRHALSGQHQTAVQRLLRVQGRLRQARPAIGPLQQRAAHADARMRQLMRHGLERRQQRLDALEARLEALNPVAVMQRGYAVVRDRHGSIVRSAEQLAPGDRIAVELGHGEALADVVSRHSDTQ